MDNVLILRDSDNLAWNDVLIFSMSLSSNDIDKIEKIIQQTKDTVKDYTIDNITEELAKHYKFVWCCNSDVKVIEW